jgi:hypothetical protein
MQRLCIVLLIPHIAISSVQAATLTLACSGTITSYHVNNNAPIPNNPEKETTVDKSVVVNLDERTVSGFLSDRLNTGYNVNIPIPIKAIDTNSVQFNEAKLYEDRSFRTIGGTIDRITGQIEATDSLRFRDGTTDFKLWHLRCKPTRPLF